MKLIGELKEKVVQAATKEEAKKAIKDAGMDLTDEELELVSGAGYRDPEVERRKLSILET